jgi:hypothetical protein
LWGWQAGIYTDGPSTGWLRLSKANETAVGRRR